VIKIFSQFLSPRKNSGMDGLIHFIYCESNIL